MSLSKVSRSLFAVVLTLVLAPFAHSHDLSDNAATVAPATAPFEGGDQINSSQDGDLTLKPSDGSSDITMSKITKDADGNITSFQIQNVVYKWNASECKYNPTTIIFTSWKFERLSEGRYKFDKLNGNDVSVMKGSLDT